MISKVTISKTRLILIISGKMKPLETFEQKLILLKYYIIKIDCSMLDGLYPEMDF